MRTVNTTFVNAEALKQFCTNNNIPNTKRVLLQVFSGVLDRGVLYSLIQSIKSILPDINIIGSTTDGEIIDGNVQTETIILSFSIFEKTDIAVYVSKQEDAGSETGKKLISLIKDIQKAKVAIVFADGIGLNGEVFVESFNKYAPNLAIAGGIAGDNASFRGSYVFTHNGIEKNSVVTAVLLGEELIVTRSFSFGWEEIGKELVVTKSKANLVYTIDNISAVDVYTKYLGDDIAKRLPLTGIEFPLIINRDGKKIARAVLAKNEDGSLLFAGNIRAGERVYLGYGNIDTILNDRHLAYDDILKNPAESIFIYSCMTRKRLLKDDIALEVSPLSKVAPISGFFTYGEFYCYPKNKTSYENLFLNQAMTILALSEDKTKTNPLISHKLEPYQHNTQTIKAFTHLIEATTKDLEKSKRKMQEYIDLINENILMLLVNLEGIILDASQAFCELSGFSKDELIDEHYKTLIHKDSPKEDLRNLYAAIKLDKTWKGEIKSVKKNKKHCWIEVSVSPNFDSHKNKITYTALGQEITAKKTIEKISITDGLTKIFNRRHFDQIFPRVINSAKRKQNLVSFLILDIDFFKQYNDTYGHQMGDEALIKIAACIKKQLRRGDDYCFRIGGEEFGVIFAAKDKQHAISFSEALRQSIQDLKIEHKSSTICPHLTISIGLVCTLVSQNTTAKEIYKQADTLLYEAKNSGRNKIAYN